ncbi:GDSL-type esterase/lipase family protein [Pseudarthrobacter sp. So.54]
MFTIRRLGVIAATTLALSLGAGAATTPAIAAQRALAPGASSATIGGYTVDGLTYIKWNADRDKLGDPLEWKTCNGVGCSQRFQKGWVLWTQRTGAQIVSGGPMATRYSASGWTKSWMGYPTSEPIDLRRGKYQAFQSGAMYWSETAGAHVVHGGVRGFYASHGPSENGLLGYPTSEETAVPGGVSQDFEGGKIYWSSSTGATSATRNGEIQNYYAASNGWVGLPDSDLYNLSVRGGKFQSFQRAAVYWSQLSGTHAVFGGIRAYYATHGPSENGFLGYPTSDEIGVTGGVRQDFEGGKIYWADSGTNTFSTTKGDIQTYCEAKGGPNSSLGLPISDEISWNGGYYQRFKGGVITWGPGVGPKLITAADFNLMAGNFAKYGWPIADSWTDATGSHTQFQKGVIDTAVPAKAPVYPFTNVLATAKSVVLYGDSQLDDDSWSEQGARAMGFTDQATQLAYGGMGYSTRNAWAGGTGWTAVQNKLIPFPGGTPGLVLVSLGGNDASSGQSDAQVIASSTALWAKLKEIYPNSKIVINGVMSRSDTSHTQRRHIDAVLGANAKRLGVTYISVAGLASTAGAEYRDNVHLTQNGHNTVSRLYIPMLKAALGK